MRFKPSWQRRHCNIVLELHNQKLKLISLFESNPIIFCPCLQDNFTGLHLAGWNALTPALPGQLTPPAAPTVWNQSRTLHGAYWDMHRIFQRTKEGIACLGLSHGWAKIICSRKAAHWSLQLELPWPIFMIQNKMELKVNKKMWQVKYELDWQSTFYFLWPIIV